MSGLSKYDDAEFISTLLSLIEHNDDLNGQILHGNIDEKCEQPKCWARLTLDTKDNSKREWNSGYIRITGSNCRNSKPFTTDDILKKLLEILKRLNIDPKKLMKDLTESRNKLDQEIREFQKDLKT